MNIGPIEDLVPLRAFPSFRALLFIALIAPMPCVAGLLGAGDVATKLATIDTLIGVGSMDFNADGRQLALDSLGYDGTDIYDLKRKQIVRHLPVSGSSNDRGDVVRYSSNGKLLAICGFNKPSQREWIGVYGTTTWQIAHEIVDEPNAGEHGCTGIAFTPDGKELIRFARMPFDKTGTSIVLYNTSSWQVVNRIRTAAINNNPYWPARWTIDNYVVTPDTILVNQSDPAVSFVEASLNSVYAISPNSQFLALSGNSWGGSQVLLRQYADIGERSAEISKATHGIIAIIDIPNHKLARVIQAGASSLDWSADGVQLAAAGGGSDNVAIYDSRSGDKIVAETGDSDRGLIRYTPDGKYLIAKVGKNVEIWDAPHVHLLQTIHAEPRNIAVSPDGRYLALCADDVNILDATPLLSLFAHPNGVGGKVIVYEMK